MYDVFFGACLMVSIPCLGDFSSVSNAGHISPGGALRLVQESVALKPVPPHQPQLGRPASPSLASEAPIAQEGSKQHLLALGPPANRAVLSRITHWNQKAALR